MIEEIWERIIMGLGGFFMGGVLGFCLAFLLFIPLICIMGLDWTFDQFMFGPAHNIIFRVLVILGGLLGILISQYD